MKIINIEAQNYTITQLTLFKHVCLCICIVYIYLNVKYPHTNEINKNNYSTILFDLVLFLM